MGSSNERAERSERVGRKERQPGLGKKKQGSSGKDAVGEKHKPKRPRQDAPAQRNPVQSGPSAKKSRKAGLERLQDIAATIAERPAAEQADWVWGLYQADTGATELEREGLTRDCFCSATPMENLGDSLASLEGHGVLMGRQQGAATGPGSPAGLVITAAAARAVDLIRQCPTYNQATRIGKLFAKHLKQAEQETMLANTVLHLGVGTPNRLLKLAQSGSLKLDRLQYIVLDVHQDVKKRTLLDMPETKSDFWKLFEDYLRPAVARGARFVLCSSG